MLKLSELLLDFKEKIPESGISIEKMLLILEDRAIGILLLLMALPNAFLLASIPLVSSVFGSIILVLGIHLILNKKELILPSKFKHTLISKQIWDQIFHVSIPWIKKSERFLIPRLDFCFSSLGERLIGIIVLCVGICIALPIPFGNFFPGITLVILSLGLIMRDGFTTLIGLSLSLGVLLILFMAYKTLFLWIFETASSFL